MSSEEINVKEHLNNLIEAVIALSPSRNYITQLFTVSPMDYPTLYDAHPEILKDEEMRKVLVQVFNLSMGANIEIRGGLGYDLVNFINSIFSKLENEEIRNALNEFLKNVRREPVPNLHREWIELRLKGVAMEPTYGRDSLRILKLLAETKEPYEYRCDLEELLSKTGIDEARMRRIVDLLMAKFRLIEKDDRAGKEGYRIPYNMTAYLPELIMEQV